MPILGTVEDDARTLSIYRELLQEKAQILQRTQRWMDVGTNLYNNISDTSDKATLLALRNQMISDLRAILGV